MPQTTRDAFDYAEDTDKTASTSNEALQRLNDLVSQAVKAEVDAAEAEEVAKTKRANLNALLEDLIPSAMDSIGMEEFRTTSGFKVKIKKTVSHSLAADRKEAGMEWLEQNGHGGVIKREVTVSFAKGQEKEATQLVSEVQAAHPGLPLQSSRNVASATLGALIRQLLEGGVVVPVDIFKVREVRKAIID